MFLPFLLGLCAAILAIARQRNASIAAWVITALVIVVCLKYHATDALGLSF